MARGRPRKPLERQVALARGDGRTPSKLPVPVVPRDAVTSNRRVPPAPRGLSKRGKLEWRKVWEAGFWLKPTQDYHWVEMIARAYSEIEVYRAQVEVDGLITKGYAGQDAAHPLIAEIRKNEATIQKCLSILGFSPTDRARLNLADLRVENEFLRFQRETQANRK